MQGLFASPHSLRWPTLTAGQRGCCGPLFGEAGFLIFWGAKMSRFCPAYLPLTAGIAILAFASSKAEVAAQSTYPNFQSGPGTWTHPFGDNIRRETVLDIKGEVIPGNQHDILTGSDPDGRAFIDGYDHTCNNWTSDAMTYPQANPNVPADRARAMLGHSDRGGQNTSWITSHLSQGCSKQALINTGGAGHLYCFAAN